MIREPRYRYVDPLDAIWLSALKRVGFRVKRTSEVFASTDGEGLLLLGARDTLDPDDSVAQMVFHELCHSLVQGPDNLRAPDWGLHNDGSEDTHREHATLRLQAHLSAEYGLRGVLAPTTDFRAFYDALPSDALVGDEPCVALAREALDRVDRAPWGPHVRVALRATARVLAAVAEAGAADGVEEGDLQSLLTLFRAP